MAPWSVYTEGTVFVLYNSSTPQLFHAFYLFHVEVKVFGPIREAVASKEVFYTPSYLINRGCSKGISMQMKVDLGI